MEKEKANLTDEERKERKRLVTDAASRLPSSPCTATRRVFESAIATGGSVRLGGGVGQVVERRRNEKEERDASSLRSELTRESDG